MKRARILLLAPVLMLVAAHAMSVPAAAQQATPLPPLTTDNAGPVSAIADPSLTNKVPETPGDDRRACKHVVVVEDIPYTWDKLEKGTDTAWLAYSNGEFVNSVPIFARLADLGHPVAEWLLGNVYYFGQGVPLDYRTSLTWFEKAALQGCFAAYAPTAQMYEQGEGTAVDLGKAYMWYNIAVAQLPQGKERREMMQRREKVGALLTTAQVEAAQKRSLQFSPKLEVPPDPSQLPEDFFKQP